MIEINWKILLVQAITFLLGLLILWKIAYKSIRNIISERAEKIRTDFEKASEEREAMEKLRNEYEVKLKDIESEVKRLIIDATKSGQQIKEEVILEARNQAQKILAKSEEKISIEREKAIKEMKDEIANISLLTVEKILKQTVDKKVHSTLVEDFVSNLK